MSALKTDKNAAHGVVAPFWNEAWNPPYSIAVFDELVAGDFAISTDGCATEDKEAFSAWLQAFQSKIGNLRTQPEAILVA